MRGKRANIDPDDLRRMYHDEKIPSSQIAKHYGVDPQTILNHMKRHGIDRRPPGAQEGRLNSAWNGGKTLDKDGYVLVLCPDHPKARKTGYVLEHRLVMEMMIGRILHDHEVVHHRDGDHSNNHPANLMLFEANADHLRHELTGRVPQWTEQGLEAIRRAPRPNGEWTDERREKARQNAIHRWENGGIRRREWGDDDRDHMRQVAYRRKRSAGRFV